jgi:hypothetical protein
MARIKSACQSPRFAVDIVRAAYDNRRMDEDRVRSWLKTQGYPLELRVAQALRAIGVWSDHGRVYSDPITRKVREIDLMGYFDYWRPAEFSVHLVFECKHSRDKPWVMFCTADEMMMAAGFVASMPATPSAKDALVSVADETSIQDLRLFRRPSLLGFRIVRAHTDNQDAAFHSVYGVTGACVSSANEARRHGVPIVYVPVVVLDAPLILCYLSEKGKDVELQEVKHGMLLHTSAGHDRIPIHVAHVDALEQFVADIKRDSAKLHTVVCATRTSPA